MDPFLKKLLLWGGLAYVVILCGPNPEVVIPEVRKPSPAAGFFSVGVLEVPSVIPGETELKAKYGR